MLEAWVKKDDVFRREHGWHKSVVYVPMPCTKFSNTSEDTVPKFEVPGLHHRDIVDLVIGCISDRTSRFRHNYHWVPNKLFWIPPMAPHSATSSHPKPLRVYSDCINSDAVLADEEIIRKMDRIPGDDPEMEYVVLPVLIWSDETVLSSFGSATLWPIYIYFGHLSKYIRGRPTEFAAHHLAYIPSLPDSFADYYKSVYGTQPSAEVLRFCRRELFTQIWLLLLNEKFMQAFSRGIVVQCGDSVVRRTFFRIYTYSADYMEKVKIAALKPNSTYMIPQLLTRKDELWEAGMLADIMRRAALRQDDPATHLKIARARRLILEQGFSITSKRVKDLLSEYSLTPTQNAFSVRLAPHGINLYQILAPDLMHEFELGVWRGIFDHLVRLIHAQGDKVIQEFNRRMRLMPKWGRDRIRRFYDDASTRKRMAAHDYKAYLQVIMPVIEGLLPPDDNKTVADMLFELANWHALAKLRMHHDVTLINLERATTHMYAAIRCFADTTCADHTAYELPSETEARTRRARTKTSGINAGEGARRVVNFNVINTFKYYNLGNYVDYIRRSGPTDNYTTQIGELEHRHVKRVFDRTNKVNYERQIALHQQKRSMVASWRARDGYIVPSLRREQNKRAAIALADRSAPVPPTDHYFMSQSRRRPIRLNTWVDEHWNDPAIKTFLPRLYEHLAARILGDESMYSEGEEFTQEQLDGIRILDDRLYKHQYFRINYTTYDLRREQDVIHPRRQADIMVLSPEWDTSHPYWFARVLGIFHAKARYDGPDANQLSRKWRDYDFLWVRWFTYVDSELYSSGFYHRRQPRIQFVNANIHGNDPFSFINPDDVIRTAHILPCPAGPYPLTDELLGPSTLARQVPVEPGVPDNVWDYKFYTVSMFADRDIFMRHHGGGIGHKGHGVSLKQSKAHASRTLRPAVHPASLPDLEYIDEPEDGDPIPAEGADESDEPCAGDEEVIEEDSDTSEQDLQGAEEDVDEDFDGNTVDFEVRDSENEDAEDMHHDIDDGVGSGSDNDDYDAHYDLYAGEGFAPL
ncbi:hypothetical protein C8Q80DRAFT_1110314 [Daedaleopsis nitida]|nr:hypothetical protein C8Q80DRAFT_1110314 [Daedaleopsis nitida]